MFESLKCKVIVLFVVCVYMVFILYVFYVFVVSDSKFRDLKRFVIILLFFINFVDFELKVFC